MDLVIWTSDPPPGHCTLDSTSLDDVLDMHKGISVADRFPKDVSYRMSDMFPDDIELSDNFNVAGQIIVSKALKSYLDTVLEGHHIEYLPVSIMNHKDRLASSDYFIVHSLDVIDCIDVNASKVKWNPMNKTTILHCKGLVLDTKAIPAHLRLFRPKHWGDNIMIDGGLAEDMEAKGFTGLYFFPAVGFNGIT